MLVGRGVFDGVGVLDGVNVALGVNVNDGVGVRLGVNVIDGVGVMLGVNVMDGVSVGVGVLTGADCIALNVAILSVRRSEKIGIKVSMSDCVTSPKRPGLLMLKVMIKLLIRIYCPTIAPSKSKAENIKLELSTLLKSLTPHDRISVRNCSRASCASCSVPNINPVVKIKRLPANWYRLAPVKSAFSNVYE